MSFAGAEKSIRPSLTVLFAIRTPPGFDEEIPASAKTAFLARHLLENSWPFDESPTISIRNGD